MKTGKFCRRKKNQNYKDWNRDEWSELKIVETSNIENLETIVWNLQIQFSLFYNGEIEQKEKKHSTNIPTWSKFKQIWEKYFN